MLRSSPPATRVAPDIAMIDLGHKPDWVPTGTLSVFHPLISWV